ncbi:hypothetical protein [Trichloromonas sp.]|uniref:hypothetical protein n=1 Tax=Trichloromonas sp. TaxID=3069249 RepID=UPI002A4D6C02|nr:hypothetical protein [Trichloromonas sp.]
MFEILMLLGFLTIGFSHLLLPSAPPPKAEKPTAKNSPALERRQPRGQRLPASRHANEKPATRREKPSAPVTLGKIRRLC